MSPSWRQIPICCPQSHASTHVLRLSWSPDGGYLVSAHAMNNAGPTAQIIERNGWQTSLDFVGHRKAITSTRFLIDDVITCESRCRVDSMDVYFIGYHLESRKLKMRMN